MKFLKVDSKAWVNALIAIILYGRWVNGLRQLSRIQLFRSSKLTWEDWFFANPECLEEV